MSPLLYILRFLLFATLTVLALLHFKRQPSKQRLHLSVVFGFVSIAFLLSAAGVVIQLSLGYASIASALYKVYDACLMFASFWFFVFLADFVQELRRYVPLSLVAMAVVIGLITYFPTTVIQRGSSIAVVRDVWSGAGIIFYWVVNFIIGSYAFWRYSRYMEEREPRVRVSLMGVGIVFAVLAYPTDILLKLLFPDSLLLSSFAASILALIAGVFFFLGGEMPARLRRLLTK